jgi:uncharacterized protein YbjT (DUF2867 family)
MSLLIIGGTGTLGRQIVKKALDEGYQVKCLVRNLRRSIFLKDWGAELVYGDLALPETIPPTLKGVRVIIDASTVRPTDDYSAEKIDWLGKLAVLESAKVAGVKSFVFFSFLGGSKNSTIPLLDLKLRFIDTLKNSGLQSTVFHCAGFFQGLIEQYALPTLEKQTIWLLNDIAPTSYIDTQDAARIVVANLNSNISGQVNYPLIGTKAWSPEQIIQLCERLSGQKANVSYLPGFVISSLQTVLRSLEFTWNIADRLQFAEALKYNPAKDIQLLNSSPFVPSDVLTLEQYLQEYFAKILKKLKETTYQQTNNDISFL